MARLNLNEAENRLNNRNQSDFRFISNFYLTRNGENTFVRPLIKSTDEIECYSVHNVRMTGKSGKSYLIQVSCHGDGCPLCKEAQKYANAMTAPVTKVRDNIYIPLVRLYNKDREYTPSYEVFSRSTRWYRDELAPFCARYDMDGILEVQRLGTGKDTTYKLYEARKDFDGKPLEDNISIEQYKKDFEVQEDDIFGRTDSLIRDWTVGDIEEFLRTGEYPGRRHDDEVEDEEEETTPRRRSNHGF